MLLLFLAVCAPWLIGSCGDGSRAPGARDTVTIRFWNGFTGPDGRTILRIVKRFNRENPDVHVIMQRIEWGTYYNKLFVAGIGGRAPEVFVIHTDSLDRFTRAAFVRPTDDLVGGADGIDISDFDENVWSAVEWRGKHWAIPLDIHLLGMYYNRALFVQAGIVDAQGNARPPTNRQEFLDAVQKLTRDTNGDGQPEQWGFVFTWLRTNCFTLMRQNGGRLFNETGSETLIDSPQNVEALQFGSDLVRKLRVAPGPENFDAFIGFRQGKVGIVFEGIYMLPELQRQKDLNFGAAPVPVLMDEPAAWANSHNLCLRADLDARELDAAKRFVKYLSDNSLDWAEGGQIPVRKSLRDSERFQAMEAQREFARQIPHAAYMPKVPFVFEYLSEYEQAIEQILRGTLPPETALRQAAADIERIIARYRKSRFWNDRAGDEVAGGAAR
jgi:multiple sugar transport system substrate-binding protein